MSDGTVIDVDLEALNGELGPVSVRERIRIAHREFGDGLILSTSFGPTSGVMISLVASVIPDIRVITVRHGYEAPRTLEVADALTRQFNLNLHVYEAPHMLVPEEGSPEFETFRQKVKIEPFQRALAEERPRAWLSGVMREESEARRAFEFAMIRDGLVVVYPILDWTQEAAEEYALAYGLHYYEGYYDPTKGVDQKRECGLHLGDLGDSWTSSNL